MKIEIEIGSALPSGWRIVRYGQAESGEWIWLPDMVTPEKWECSSMSMNFYFILEKIPVKERFLVADAKLPKDFDGGACFAWLGYGQGRSFPFAYKIVEREVTE